MTPLQYELSHLRALEAESIHIFREVAAEFERPVLLFSGGKDSIVLLRLAEKAFRPGKFDVHHRERHPARLERLDREVQQDDRVLPAGVEQHGLLELGRHLADDVDRLGLEGLQVRQC